VVTDCLDIACEPDERLTHVLKFEPEATALGQIRLDPLRKG